MFEYEGDGRYKISAARNSENFFVCHKGLMYFFLNAHFTYESNFNGFKTIRLRWRSVIGRHNVQPDNSRKRPNDLSDDLSEMSQMPKAAWEDHDHILATLSTDEAQAIFHYLRTIENPIHLFCDPEITVERLLGLALFSS